MNVNIMNKAFALAGEKQEGENNVTKSIKPSINKLPVAEASWAGGGGGVVEHQLLWQSSSVN